MADAVVVFDDGHPCQRYHCFDQIFTATGDYQIKVLIHLRHMPHTFPVGERDELNAVLGKPGPHSALLQGGSNGSVRVERLGTSAENGCIAGFET